MKKISILNQRKSTKESSGATHSLKFPIHHKSRHNESITSRNNQNIQLITIGDMKKVIIKAYHQIESIINGLKLTETLTKNNLNDLNA